MPHNLGIVRLIIIRFLSWIEPRLVLGLAKINGEMYPAKYLFTVDYTESEIADDPAQA